MFIRCIMTVLLLIATAMPAWANAQEPDQISPEVKMLMEAGVDLYEEEVLQSLQLEVKDQLAGDTYSITFTINNPTNTPLNKKVAFTTVTYDLCHADDPYQSVTQNTDAIDALIIEPGKTYTTTINLAQPTPAKFNHLNSCTIVFEDKSSIRYDAMGNAAVTSPFRLIPTVSPFGDVSLKIQNTSQTETITKLSDIRLNFTVGKENHKMLLNDITALAIKPSETYTIPLFVLASADNTKASSPFSISAKTVNTARNYNYHINMKINGLPHTYANNSSDATKTSGSSKNTFIDTPMAHFEMPPK